MESISHLNVKSRMGGVINSETKDGQRGTFLLCSSHERKSGRQAEGVRDKTALRWRNAGRLGVSQRRTEMILVRESVHCSASKGVALSARASSATKADGEMNSFL